MLNNKMPEVIAPIETASFFEEERREKDIVESGTDFVWSQNLVAPKKNASYFKMRFYL